MTEVNTIGLDLAKNVFQVHGVDVSGETVIRRQLRRRQVVPFFSKQPACLVGIEACATSHHWARELGALGHEVRIMPAAYVKPYVKRNKNDAADAEAICEAVTRPSMRFVAVKTAAQQSVLMDHRTRELLVRQRTMLVNAIRAHMAEFGVVARVGLPQVKELLAVIADEGDERIPPLARTCLEGLARQLLSLEREITTTEQRIHAWHRATEVSQRLATIPWHRANHCERAGVAVNGGAKRDHRGGVRRDHLAAAGLSPSPWGGPGCDAACPQQADAAARAGGTCGPTGSSVWVVGSVRRRGLTPAALVEPVALAIHLEDVDVVGEAVEESAGKPLGAEHLGPFVERQIGGDQGRAPLVALAEHLEQVARRRSWTAARSRVRRRSEACRWRASSGTSAAACHRGPR